MRGSADPIVSVPGEPGGNSVSVKTYKQPGQQPELVILVRSKPEESVLAICKVAGGGGPLWGLHTCKEGTTGILCDNIGWS